MEIQYEYYNKNGLYIVIKVENYRLSQKMNFFEVVLKHLVNDCLEFPMLIFMFRHYGCRLSENNTIFDDLLHKRFISLHCCITSSHLYRFWLSSSEKSNGSLHV